MSVRLWPVRSLTQCEVRWSCRCGLRLRDGGGRRGGVAAVGRRCGEAECGEWLRVVGVLGPGASVGAVCGLGGARGDVPCGVQTTPRLRAGCG